VKTSNLSVSYLFSNENIDYLLVNFCGGSHGFGLGEGGQSFALGRNLKWYNNALDCRRPFKSKFISPTQPFAIFYRTKTLQ
jgi:hypothetical protein